jgi:hypothetical protein
MSPIIIGEIDTATVDDHNLTVKAQLWTLPESISLLIFMSIADVTVLEGQLSSLLASIRTNDSPEAWNEVASVARDIANNLRVRREGGDRYPIPSLRGLVPDIFPSRQPRYTWEIISATNSRLPHYSRVAWRPVPRRRIHGAYFRGAARVGEPLLGSWCVSRQPVFEM